jgi:exodeoxyribonuclease-3
VLVGGAQGQGDQTPLEDRGKLLITAPLFDRTRVGNMRLLSWNVNSGGGPRCGQVVQLLQRYDADVIALQETISTRAADLCHVFAEAGYTHRFSAPRGPRDRGQCLLSRVPAQRVARRGPPQASIHPRGWLEVEFPAHGFRVVAVYGPAQGPSIPAFWNATAKWLSRRATLPFIMLGDFNAGASGIDAVNYRFKAGRAFAELASIGLVDLWRREHGNTQEYTWFSHPTAGTTGRGFRIDHAFASPVVAQQVTSCRYNHEARERGWSDHSLLVVDLVLKQNPADQLSGVRFA